ncbi:ABC transporter permease subunit [Acuticoccus sp. M5D2P5]|uniref:ABC transporter permease n=1 Tax=Acuticoccus kalidii TaxID=2910977 RepID=UPI001F2CB447|nr:ABC transporter permease subunit [Acuticoccus kalidii]MCF3932014.1 ABC transporter permease subunit [Acuticoccus kalidii]
MSSVALDQAGETKSGREAAAPARASRRRAPGRTGLWPTVAKACGLFALAMIYIPLIFLAVMSFTPNPLSGVPYPLTVEHYAALAGDERWMGPMRTSLFMSALVALTCMVLATVVGRALTRMRSPGAPLLLTLIPLFVPGLTMGAALFIFLRTILGLTLGLWSIYLAQLIWALPFCLLLVLVVASRFDLNLLEAAEDLGASPWRRFFDVELPILKPGIFGAGIFGFLLSFNELPRSLFVRGIDTTMPIYNWAMAASQQSQVPIIFSLTTLLLAITLPVMGTFFWVLFVKLDKS